MTQSSPDGLHSLVAGYDRVVEVGIGRDTALSAALAANGVSVTATDISDRDVPEGVQFVVDDVTEPDLAIYEDADAIVARRLPPELQRPVFDLARTVDADLYFTTLGTDPAVVPVDIRTTETGPVFVAARR